MYDFVNPVLMAAFVPTFIFVSLTPGMCMTLSMTLGMTIGFKRTLWMMSGELVGVGAIAALAGMGAAAIMLKHPEVFYAIKYCGGAYLAYLGVNLWFSRGKMAVTFDDEDSAPSVQELISQGFFTAISNPKGWAFMMSLLPPFIDATKHVGVQVTVLVSIILCIEFTCLCIYCLGGNALRRFLQKSSNVRMLNRIAGTLMLGVAVWLAFF